MCETAGLTVLEHIPPPGIAMSRNAHVVWHNVQHQRQSVLRERGAEFVEGGLASQLNIDAPVVQDIVAVHASRRGLQDRRGIKVADSERRKILGQCGGLRQIKTAVKLNAVRGAWLLNRICKHSQAL
jgi:hypothetical protein